MIASSLSPLANHLWQSTLFAGVAWVLTLVLLKNPACVRHWVWVAASVKFLVPFALLVAIGSRIEWRKAPAIAPNVSVVVEQVSQPFATNVKSLPLSVTVLPEASTVPQILATAWAIGFIGIACSWLIRWRRIAAAVHAGSPVALGLPVRAISAPFFLEPGIFGVFRPTLLLPDGIFEHLSPEQWKSIVAHELCHVRRRDNLVGVAQMLIETVFWFHPLVWWIGKRIFEERERACDEEVLRLGSEPRVYAQGILKVCELYLESPVVCMAGVSGSNLRRRIEGIMNDRIVSKVTTGKKLFLAGVAMLALVTPVVVGTLSATLRAQTVSATTPRFEVASIKPNLEGSGDFSFDITPAGRVTARNFSVWNLIRTAYGLRFLQMSGGPTWIKSRGFDIQAQPAQSDTQVPREQVSRMLQALLEDRFQLKWHSEPRETSAYGLTVAAHGPKLSPPHEGRGRRAFGDLNVPSMTLDELRQILEFDLDRPVVNQTTLSGPFDIQLQWASERAPAANRADNESRPSLFTALQDQIGLKLESIKAKVDFFVIDSVEAPSAN